MNSDTSQEILKYQKEWAMKFHEHTSGKPNDPPEAPKNPRGIQLETKNEIEKRGAAGDAGNDLLDQSSSMMTGNRNEESSKMQTDQSQQHINQINKTDYNFYNIPNETTDSNDKDTAIIVGHTNNPNEEDIRSRNKIMNGGKQLSLMTVNSSVMSNSADLLFDYFKQESKPTDNDNEDEYLTFQLCEGEEMNTEMANFIGIHMLNDGYTEGDEANKDDHEGGLNYQCPKTGSHFQYMDLLARIRTLKQKRNVIDDAIKKEDER